MSSTVDVDAILAENELLRTEVRALRGLIHGQTVAPGPLTPRVGVPPPINTQIEPSSASSSSGGGLKGITASEIQAMKAIFDVFDEDRDGLISVTDLAKLHAKLGEPITEDEAREAVHIVGSGTGSISFEDLARYWDGTHPALAKGYVEDGVRPEALNIERERRRTWYRARFKFVRAKIPNAAVGRVSTEAEGPCPSLEYRLRFFYNDPHAGKVPISPWHDVPLRNGDGTFNMIVEIPKWTRKKFEIATGELFNPIKQDVKNGCLREYQWGDQLFNYGALPQTWEDPKVILGESGTPGDNDPIDIVELGAKMWGVGSIVRVKILGVIGLIDAGETDWKLIGISAEDPMAHLLDDLDDVNIHMPGAIDALRTWLQLYKLPVVNSFVFNGAARDREFALSVVEETHQHWLALVNGAGPGLGEKGAPCISAAGLRRSSSLTALSSLLGTPALE